MLLFYREFGLKPPEKEKFDKIFKTYFDNFKKLSDKIDKKPASPEKKILEKAIQTAAGDFEDWWAVQLEAKKYEGTKPEKADEIYRKGIEQFPESPELLGNYGVFLHLGAKDNEKTEKYYKRSLELDPNDATVLGNYGLFLYQMRKDYDRAERYYEQALKNDPNNAIVLGNYANLLHLIRKDYQKAEEYYKRSLENDPDDADFLGNYATFLYKVRKDNVRVEEYYKRSLEKDPNSSFQSANYGDFLLSQGRYKDGMQLIEKALASQEIKSGTKIECHFYLYAHSKDLKEESRHLSELKKSLLLGDRSPGWDLQQNVDRAIKDGHPEPEFLKALAKVIADEMKIEELEKFEVWRKA
jgi:Tfp pilus assembly protein PilF